MAAPPEQLHRLVPPWRDPASLQTVAYVLVSAAAAWFLLRTLGSAIRPLLLAVILAYVLMPYHSRLRNRVTAPVSIVLLGGLTVGLLVGLALAVYASVLGLSEELPALQSKAVAMTRGGERWVAAHVPWFNGADSGQMEERMVAQAGQVALPILNAAADALLEACVVGLYLVFLLLEASRFPDRVRKAYVSERAEEILHVAGQVNAAVVSYLKAKVKASLWLAIPAGVLLGAFGVRFALLWAVLTFLCNFIPYVGSVVAYSLPVGFAFLQLDLDWHPVAVAVLLLAWHLTTASVIEPMLLGKAVGLSPLMILGSLAFWGLLWGIAGMFLAVPLTMVVVIVLSQFPLTRPVAQLVTGE